MLYTSWGIDIEVPGSGDGPREADIARAIEIMKSGISSRANQR